MIMIIRRVHEALNFSTRMRSIRRRYENSREKVQNVLGDSSAVGFGAARPAIDFDARRVHHVVRDPVRHQITM